MALKVLVNGRPIEEAEPPLPEIIGSVLGEVSPSDTVGGVLNSIVKRIVKEGYTITEVCVDGKSFPSNDSFLNEIIVERVDELNLAVERIHSIIVDGLKNLIGFLEKIRESTIHASKLITQGKNEEAMELLTKSVDGLKWCIDFIRNVAIIRRINLSEARYGVGNVKYNLVEILENVTDALREINGALKRRDFVTVGDILEYELPNLIVEWKAFAEGLLREIGNVS